MSNLKSNGKKLLSKFKEHNVTLLAAAQGYYYLLAIFPLLMVCFAIIPYLNLDPTQVLDMLEKQLPSGIVGILEDNIINLIETPKGGLLTIGVIGALWSASNGINAFIKSVNTAYNIEEKRSFIIVRLVALGLTVGLIAGLAVAIILLVFGNTIMNTLASFFNLDTSATIILQILRVGVSLLVLTGILLTFYRFAPSRKLPLKHVFPGAISASILWLLTSFGFSFYIDNFANYSATYGSLGGIIILMIWFFVTGIILLVGALINVIYHENHRNDIA